MARTVKKQLAEPVAPRRGRPPLPDEEKRTGRISMRTYPEIEEKVRRNGTEWLERIIRRAKDRENVQ